MSINKTENGSWMIQIRTYDKKGKIVHKRYRGYATKREARQAEAAILIEAEQAKEKWSSDIPSFRKVAENYFSDNDTSEDTAQKKRRMFEMYCDEFIDDPINTITKERLVAWRATIAELDRSTRTKNNCIAYIRSVFRFASHVYDIPDNSALLRSFKQTAKEINHEMQVWTVPEFNKFISVVDRPLYSAFFTFLFWTGCRRGKAMSLQKEYVNAKKRTVTIKQSMRDTKSGIRPTKNKKDRTVKLDSHTRSVIEPLLSIHGKYLFGGDTPLTRTTIDRELRIGIEKSGVKRIRLHDFRHSHASLLLDSKISIVAVAKRLGDTIETVQETYAHLMQNNEKEMYVLIEKLATKVATKNKKEE